jgi:PBP1b-binding outer membrane lipoprotein LpoB
MKSIAAAILTLIVLLSGCAGGSNALTEGRAQKAIDRFMSGFSGHASVQGVQEIPQENAAKVDIKFTNFKYNDQMMGYSMDYSDLGTAIFSKYNDGRWVLTRVEVPGYRGNHWDVNIPVE